MKKFLIIVAVLFAVFVLLILGGAFIYQKADIGYQAAMDPKRKEHCDQIVKLILEYGTKVGKFPLQELATDDEPIMVVMGHSIAHEDAMAAEKVLARGAKFLNSGKLEKELSDGLGRKVVLPRDPQKVPTYAPNVYVYFVTPDQMAVAVHLFQPSDSSKAYQWRKSEFHSHAIAYPNKSDWK